MRKSVLLLTLFMGMQAFALDKTLVTVKDSSVSNGVVIVSISESGKRYDLQCNQSASFCTAVKPGDYWMVRLPQNHGLYDCTDVDLYPQSADPQNADKVGEYCLSEK
jgi:hypothetical protein